MAPDGSVVNPPLYCYSGLSNDEFAGWYAVSSSSQCKDFCFWKQPDGDGNLGYTTGNPHQLTRTLSGGVWGCLIDALGDDDTWSTAFDIYEDYSGHNTTFPHLKCSLGAGQKLKSVWQDLANSIAFYWVALLVAIFIMIGEVVILRRRRQRRRSLNDLVVVDENADSDDRDGTSEDDQDNGIYHDGEGFIENAPQERSRQKYSFLPTCSPRMKKMSTISAMVMLNLVALFVVFASTVSLLELQQGVDLPFRLKVFTPACADADALCPAGHYSIERESKEREGSEAEAFSYLIASDSQLDWYDGESAYIGKMNYPPPCTSRDSCNSCTKKMGQYTNSLMKRSIEKLLGGDELSATPVPKTLVMNGDLTQYFHRDEFLKYASFYHDISGLHEYFPSLGNHDYDQGTATYNGDEWIGPNYCNGRHAVAYFRSAFCDKIPNFDAKERVTRYDPKSLAYSWEQGNYHFIHAHYFPHYENAALGIASSLNWLEQDLLKANEKNLTSVVFVHSVYGIPQSLEQVLLRNNVAVIFAGHLHRCLGVKCSFLVPLNTKEADDFLNKTDSNTVASAEKCFPASASLCGTNAAGNGMFYLRDMSSDLTLPQRKLWSEVPIQGGKCPVGKYATYINKTDNTALCREIIIEGKFPATPDNNSRTIPVLWSGSSSFQTFLKADFYHDRITVNFLTATEGNEGRRYVDTHTVPNAVYPSHDASDFDEVTIFI